MDRVRKVLAAAYAVEQRLGATRNLAVVAALADIRSQLAGLVHAGFITETGYARLPDLLRYLTAIERRLDRLRRQPAAGPQQQDRIAVVQKEYARPARRAAAGPPAGDGRPADPLDDRGVAGERLRPGAGHPVPGLRAADLPGDGRRRGPLSRRGPLTRPAAAPSGPAPGRRSGQRLHAGRQLAPVDRRLDVVQQDPPEFPAGVGGHDCRGGGPPRWSAAPRAGRAG